MDVSVIIPTYNRRDRIAAALESVLSQKGTSFEVLVIDDGSTDGSAERIESRFPEVRYVYFPVNRGPAAARNEGIRLASGRWIAFLDSDDVWMSGKLEAQLAFFREHPDMRLCQTEEIWIRNGRRVNPMNKHKKYGGSIFERCLDLCLISPSAVMIEKKLLEECNGFDERYPACEDYELWLRITCRHKAGLIETPYVKKFGGHADQRSQEFPAMDLFRIRALAKALKSGELTEPQIEAAQSVLAEKAAIFLGGASKRGNTEGIREVTALLQETETTLDLKAYGKSAAEKI